jgi:hypothetical protein
MIGEQKFDVVEPGRKYLLSDETEIRFMGRGADGDVTGITNEELIGVLIHRLSVQRELFKSREAYWCLTHLEEAEQWLWRWDINRLQGKRKAAA